MHYNVLPALVVHDSSSYMMLTSAAFFAPSAGSANAWLAAQGSDWVYAPNALIAG
jgi:hypothetical protein